MLENKSFNQASGKALHKSYDKQPIPDSEIVYKKYHVVNREDNKTETFSDLNDIKLLTVIRKWENLNRDEKNPKIHIELENGVEIVKNSDFDVLDYYSLREYIIYYEVFLVVLSDPEEAEHANEDLNSFDTCAYESVGFVESGYRLV